MELRALIRVALTALKRNRMRTLLTTLGIVIGVGAVIASIGIGKGAEQKVESQFNSLGTNLLWIVPGTTTKGGIHQYNAVTRFTNQDVEAIKRNCSLVLEVSPSLNSVYQVVAGNQNWSTRVTGGNADYLAIRNYKVAQGRSFTYQEVGAAAKVCVIGRTVVDNLFGAEDPVGKTVRIKNVPFQVIGVLEQKGESGGMQDEDDQIIAPYTAVMRRLMGKTYFDAIVVSALSREEVQQAQAQITVALRQSRHISRERDSDFTIGTLEEIIRMAQEGYNVMIIVISSIAGLSLIVGGIGIMNIMLVSVTERTREIGIRMAVGAKERDILMQFLIEAVVLSLFGGMLGIVCGVGGAILVSALVKFNVFIQPGAVLLSFGFSAMVGIFFGYYPARKASQLDPIQALHYQ